MDYFCKEIISGFAAIVSFVFGLISLVFGSISLKCYNYIKEMKISFDRATINNSGNLTIINNQENLFKKSKDLKGGK